MISLANRTTRRPARTSRLGSALTLGKRASGAVATTFVTAGGSLVLQVVAARSLGAAGYGTFVLCTTVLTLIVSVQTGWVGDSLTVLDRHDRSIRGALLLSHLGFVVAGGVISTTVFLLLRLGGTGTAAVFAVLVAVWITEELGRRILMARQEFWKLVVNDLVYVVVTLGALVVWYQTGHRLSVSSYFVMMTVGAAAAVVVALLQLPRRELAGGRLSRAGVRKVLDFAAWRSAQAAIRPFGLFVTRVLIATLASRAVLGEVEAARLLLAPALTLLNGVGVFLLPYYARQNRESRGVSSAGLLAVIGALVVVTCAVGTVATVLVEPLSRLLTSGDFPIEGRTVLGWTAFAVAYAAGMPCATLLVAQRRSRLVFQLRLVDLLVGTALVVAVASLGIPTAAPLAVAVGAFVGAGLLFRQAVQSGPDKLGGNFPRLPGSRQDESDPPTPGANSQVPIRRRVVVLPGHWMPVAALAMMVTSEYKLRLRPPTSTLGGTPDLQVLLEILTYVAVAAYLALTFGHAPRLRRTSAVICCMWIFVAVLAVSTLWSPYRLFGAIRATQLVVVAALAHTVARHGSRAQVHRFLHAFAVLVAGSVLLGVAIPFPRTHLQASRFTWLYVHPVTAGTYLALAVVILVAYLAPIAGPRAGPKWHPATYGLLLLTCAGGLLATQTRGAIGGALAGSMLLLYLRTGRSRRVDLLAAASLVVSPAVWLGSEQIISYLSRGEDASQLASFNNRTTLWDQALQAFRLRPLAGSGIAASRGIFLDATGLGGGHNAFINVLTDAGVVGVLAWLALLTAIAIISARFWTGGADSPDVLTVAGLGLALVVNSFTNEGLGAAANVSSIFLFILAGWLGLIRRESTEPPTAVPLAAVGAVLAVGLTLGLAVAAG